MIDRQAIQQRWDDLHHSLDERGRRLFAAAEVRAAGYGGLAVVADVTGLARSTINRGEDDLDAGSLPKGRVRRKGGGRRALRDADPALVDALRARVEPATLGDPMRPLTWVSKSLHKLAAELKAIGHQISHETVRSELVKLGFSRQGNRKADEGSKHPDRDAQFEHINAKVMAAQAAGQPVISVDSKKKELVGNYKNGGTDYRPKGTPRRVKVHDFEDKELGKVAPYGVYDVTANDGWVNVGITADTAEFAVQSIRLWHVRMGQARYPHAAELKSDLKSPTEFFWRDLQRLNSTSTRTLALLTCLGAARASSSSRQGSANSASGITRLCAAQHQRRRFGRLMAF
ncbi:MAG: ISAzo13 family transposase [Hyphomicrobium aestuarii]|nr:ISAzo13 family transposase [Hyphomicrobium aestuarii]